MIADAIGAIGKIAVDAVDGLLSMRAKASAEERAEIDRILAIVRTTDTHATARADADLAVRKLRGEPPIGERETEPPTPLEVPASPLGPVVAAEASE